MATIDPTLIAVFVVAAFFIVWYYAGFAYNRRRARRIATELKDAVLAFGGTSKVRWFGTGAFRMTTEGADAPFKEVAITVTLRPREMPINWALDSAGHRTDTALVEASLRANPKVEFEVVDPGTRVGGRRAKARTDWTDVTLGDRRLLLHSDAEKWAQRILEEVGAETLAAVGALHVTAGSNPGIAASLAVAPGTSLAAVSSVRALADRLRD